MSTRTTARRNGRPRRHGRQASTRGAGRGGSMPLAGVLAATAAAGRPVIVGCGTNTCAPRCTPCRLESGCSQGARRFRLGVARALRRGGADATDEAHFAAVLEKLDALVPGARSVRRSRRGVPAARRRFRTTRSMRCSAGDRRVPRANRRRDGAAGGRGVHARVRHRQAVERLQLVSGQLPQPDPGQHRVADFHRSRDRSRVPRGLSRASRLQRAAREASGAGSRLASSSRCIRCSRRNR